MFFTPELLAKRDSGFGLIWLAATLGSKSTFKKLPKKSVLTADITQLCDLITEPAEPLALRLSSNLMYGVVRVYKVKQEIFMSDVTNCVASLKKMLQEISHSAASEAQLQMAQPTVRPSTLTVAEDPNAAYVMHFDSLVTDWDKFLNIQDQDPIDDANFSMVVDEEPRKYKKKALSAIENVRRDPHTLLEHHDHLLSASFDLSFTGSGGGAGDLDISSSQIEQGFAFDDNFFALSDGFGMDLVGDLGGDLGDELAKELGWGDSPAKSSRNDDAAIEVDNFHNVDDFGVGFDIGGFSPNVGVEYTRRSTIPMTLTTPKKRKSVHDSDKENRPPLSSCQKSVIPSRDPTPATFSQMLLSQDLEAHALHIYQPQDQQNLAQNQENNRRKKKTRLLLDARTELTDEELKIARAQYLEAQNNLRRGIELKRLQKDSSKTIQELIWGVPKGINAQSLVNFWQENFRVQVEARSGNLYIHHEEPIPKRRKLGPPDNLSEEMAKIIHEVTYNPELDVMMDFENDFFEAALGGGEGHLRSSEEPGQGRRNSRTVSGIGGSHFGLDIQQQPSGSQRSSLFPWDNAAASLSDDKGSFGLPGSGDVQIDHVETNLRRSSQSRRESSLGPSPLGSFMSGIGFSPGGPITRNTQTIGEDYAFDLGNQPAPEETQETQNTDMNVISLERNSYNFHEYAKMQYQTLPGPGAQLTFDIIVPKATSTHHVAAAAFYHCLVLATKDMFRLNQQEPYGPIVIGVA